MVERDGLLLREEVEDGLSVVDRAEVRDCGEEEEFEREEDSGSDRASVREMLIELVFTVVGVAVDFVVEGGPLEVLGPAVVVVRFLTARFTPNSISPSPIPISTSSSLIAVTSTPSNPDPDDRTLPFEV